MSFSSVFDGKRELSCDGLVVEFSARHDDGVLQRFFEVYDKSFILDSEKESIDGFIRCLKLNQGPEHLGLLQRFGPFVEVVAVARQPGAQEVVGGANFLLCLLPKGNEWQLGYTLNLNYLFVAPDWRGKGLASEIRRACDALARQLIAEIDPASRDIKGLTFFEINDPFKLTQEQYRQDTEHAGIDQVQRLKYWAHQGARVVDWGYVQPALSPHQADDNTLALAVLDAGPSPLPASVLLQHLERFFGISVLKGGPIAQSDSACSQIETLRAWSRMQRHVPLLSLQGRAHAIRCAIEKAPAERPKSLIDALGGGPTDPLGYDAGKSHAFFTLSLLIDGALLNEMTHGQWEKGVLTRLQKGLAETQKLQNAINPMFEDIADRYRKLFITDFLLDVGNMASDAGPNVFDEVTLSIKEGVRWETEGVAGHHEIDEIKFGRVRCRAFWMVHSNDALSYHLSLEVPWEKNTASCYGLSLLLKALDSAREKTDHVLDEKSGWLVHSHRGGSTSSILGFIEQSFVGHAGELFSEFAKLADHRARRPLNPQFVWQRCVLRENGSSREKVWAKMRNRRLLVVLRDEEIFDLIGSVRESFSRQDGDDKAPSEDLLKAAAEKVSWPPGEDKILVEFLSGFFQNIVDFRNQDDLEIQDGIAPLYPSAQDKGCNLGYFVYATAGIVFEVVGTSRSLDRTGRAWLGTCPYIFLVHAMAMHNEAIVHEYEVGVSRLIGKLERSGVFRTDRGRFARMKENRLLTEAAESLKDFRLDTFSRVHKHLSFNVFRYETEQTFFKRIETIRGTVARQKYWDDLLAQLSETIGSMLEDRQARTSQKLSWVGLVIAIVGLLQIVFVLWPVRDEPGQCAATVAACADAQARVSWSYYLGLVAIALAVLSVVYMVASFIRDGLGRSRK